MSMFGNTDWTLGSAERVVVANPDLLGKSHLIVGITRLRNESLILKDTLDHVGVFVDAIVAYDDASSDETRNILRSHPKVALIIENDKWVGGAQARLEAETRHRGLLLDMVRRKMRGEWIYCFDADERIIGDLRDFLSLVDATECNGIRVRLFDAYLTQEDSMPVVQGEPLLDRRLYFGPECRDILMLWRNLPKVRFCGLDSREPIGVERVVTLFRCQHYGKAISEAQWESTCDYYVAHFPYDTYGKKWLDRKGRAVHAISDFGSQLYSWGPVLFEAATPLSSILQRASSTRDNRSSARPAILLATNHLFCWGGSETLLLTLIEGLREHGCQVTVYVRRLDRSWASGLCDREVFLTDDLETLRTRDFDLAHVQHNSCLMDVRATFPLLPVVFSSLGVMPFLEQPPPFDCGVAQYLGVSEEVRDNLVACGVPSNRIEIVRNLVSESRFVPIKPIRSKPERILVISNKLNDARKVILRSAARVIGASIRFVGGEEGAMRQDQLAAAINDADVVVSLGRGVVEAMLCGRIPLIFDVHGGDGLVTPDNLNELRTCNFSGRYYRQEYTVSALVVELGKYRAEYGERLRELALNQFGLETNLPRLLEIYAAVVNTKLEQDSERLKTIAFCSMSVREELLVVKRMQSHVKNLQAELHRVKKTVSWQVTKPLRLVANLTRRLIRRNFFR